MGGSKNNHLKDWSGGANIDSTPNPRWPKDSAHGGDAVERPEPHLHVGTQAQRGGYDRLPPPLVRTERLGVTLAAMFYRYYGPYIPRAFLKPISPR